MTRESQRKIAEQAIEIKKTEINTRIINLQLGSNTEFNDAVLQEQKDLIDAQRDLDVINATLTIQNQEELDQAVENIIAKSNAAKLELQRDYSKRFLENQLTLNNLQLESDKK